MTSARFATAVLALVTACALAGPLVIPFDGIRQDRRIPFAPPDRVHWLGTDEFGRDELARLLKGTRISLFAGVFATAIAVGCGLAIGLVAGFYAGWTDEALMRIAELFQAVPWVYLLLGIRALLPLSIPPATALLGIGLIAGLIGWPRPARLIRGVVLTERERDYVAAARAFGASGAYLIRRHIMPATYGLVAVQAVLLIPQFILAEVTLSFLGLGLTEPAPSLGNMLTALRDLHVLTSFPWMLAPAALVVVITGACQSLGKSLQAVYERVH